MEFRVSSGLFRFLFSFLLLVGILFSFTLTPCFAIESSIKKWTIDDSLSFPRIGRVVASPNSKMVAFISTRIKQNDDEKIWCSSLFLKDMNGLRNFSKNMKCDVSMPRWSPDGLNIAYLSKGDRFQSIWLRNIVGRKIIKIAELDNDIISFRWSNNGKYIAFVTAGNMPLLQKNKLVDVEKNYTNLKLYVLPIFFDLHSKIPPKLLTPDNLSISILDPYYDGGFTWSPDDKRIAFAYQTRPGAAYANLSKLAIIELSDTKKIRELAYSEAHQSNQPLYSPDGKWIAFRSNLRGEKNAPKVRNDLDLYNRVCVANTLTLNVHCLSNTFNENPTIIGWNADSNKIFVFDNYRTTITQFYALNVHSDSQAEVLSSVDGFIDPDTISLGGDHSVFGFAYETTSSPPEPYVSKVFPFSLSRISATPESLQVFHGTEKVVHWASLDGRRIEGLLMLPKEANTKKLYPLVVVLHGGPTGVWSKRYLGGCWGYGKKIIPICWGDLLDEGFAVFQPNIRGSGGYGSDFRMANYCDFGGKDFQDVMTGIAYLIKDRIADPKHLALFGWSYGGYLAAWAITQTSHFKSAVAGAAFTDFISFSGTTDVPEYLVEFLGAEYQNEPELYLKRSPIFYANNISTPLLLMSGEKDIRVPSSQSQELYVALIRQHKPVKWLLFPNEGHVPTNPNLLKPAITQTEEWLSKAKH